MLKVNHFNWIHEGHPDANVHRMPPWNSRNEFVLTQIIFVLSHPNSRFEPTQPPPTQKENTWHFVSPVFGYSKNFLTKQTDPTKKNIQQQSLKKNPPNHKTPVNQKKKRPPPKTAGMSSMNVARNASVGL